MDSKITLLVAGDVWRRFRIACLERGLVAGREFEEFMISKLAKWAKEKSK